MQCTVNIHNETWEQDNSYLIVLQFILKQSFQYDIVFFC